MKATNFCSLRVSSVPFSYKDGVKQSADSTTNPWLNYLLDGSSSSVTSIHSVFSTQKKNHSLWNFAILKIDTFSPKMDTFDNFLQEGLIVGTTEYICFYIVVFGLCLASSVLEANLLDYSDMYFSFSYVAVDNQWKSPYPWVRSTQLKVHVISNTNSTFL